MKQMFNVDFIYFVSKYYTEEGVTFCQSQLTQSTALLAVFVHGRVA